jgi:hypothetical protein
MRAPQRTSRAPQAPRRQTAIRSTVKSAQIRPAKYTPDAEKQVTATVGTNPSPPATRSAAVQLDPAAPHSSGSPVSYAPFGYGLDPW